MSSFPESNAITAEDVERLVLRQPLPVLPPSISPACVTPVTVSSFKTAPVIPADWPPSIIELSESPRPQDLDRPPTSVASSLTENQRQWIDWYMRIPEDPPESVVVDAITTRSYPAEHQYWQVIAQPEQRRLRIGDKIFVNHTACGTFQLGDIFDISPEHGWLVFRATVISPPVIPLSLVTLRRYCEPLRLLDTYTERSAHTPDRAMIGVPIHFVDFGLAREIELREMFPDVFSIHTLPSPSRLDPRYRDLIPERRHNVSPVSTRPGSPVSFAPMSDGSVFTTNSVRHIPMSVEDATRPSSISSVAFEFLKRQLKNVIAVPTLRRKKGSDNLQGWAKLEDDHE